MQLRLSGASLCDGLRRKQLPGYKRGYAWNDEPNTQNRDVFFFLLQLWF